MKNIVKENIIETSTAVIKP